MQLVEIESIELSEQLEDVYNMEVENTHCFAVNGGYIVHNCRYAIEEKSEYSISMLDVL